MDVGLLSLLEHLRLLRCGAAIVVPRPLRSSSVAAVGSRSRRVRVRVGIRSRGRRRRRGRGSRVVVSRGAARGGGRSVFNHNHRPVTLPLEGPGVSSCPRRHRWVLLVLLLEAGVVRVGCRVRRVMRDGRGSSSAATGDGGPRAPPTVGCEGGSGSEGCGVGRLLVLLVLLLRGRGLHRTAARPVVGASHGS